MKRKRLFLIYFFLVITASIYPQSMVETTGFRFVANNVSQELFIKDVNNTINSSSTANTINLKIVDKLPNSVINEIDRCLIDYYPLNDGGYFFFSGNIIHPKRYFFVWIRIINAGNFQWEYIAQEYLP